jgi:hypothetical protein
MTDQLIHAGALVRDLVRGTAVLWWRNAWVLMTIVLVGMAGRVGAQAAAVELGVTHDQPVLALALFTVGILVEVATLFAMVRVLASDWAGRGGTTPGEEPEPEREPVLHALAVTLLPLIAIFSANGVVDDRVETLVNASAKETGVFGVADSAIMGVLTDDWARAVPVFVVAYVLRRVLDALHERTGWRWLGLLTAWIELLFLLLVFVVARRVVAAVHGWWSHRQVAHDVSTAWNDVAGWFAGFKVPIPDAIAATWHLFWDTLWPPLLDGFVLPLAWLAATALVFGYRELGGRSLVEGMPVPERLQRLADRRPSVPKTRHGRFAVSELTDLLAGDARDKYLPTLHGLKRVLRVGPLYLGVFCLLYGAVTFLTGWSQVATEWLLGVRTPNFWIAGEHLHELAIDLVWEPIRICLLAAAFIHCLTVSTVSEAGTSDAARPAPVR